MWVLAYRQCVADVAKHCGPSVNPHKQAQKIACHLSSHLSRISMQQHWTYVLNLKLSVWPSFLVYKIRGSCYRSCLADVAKHYKTWPLSGLAYTLLKLQGCPVSIQDMEGCPPLIQHAMCLSYCWEAELPQTHCRWKRMLSDGRVSQKGCQHPVY